MALTPKQRVDAIDALEEAVMSELAKRLKNPDAPSSDFTLAWNICKDAGVLANFDRHSQARDMLEDFPPMEAVELEEEKLIKEMG